MTLVRWNRIGAIFFALLEYMHPGFVRTTFILTYYYCSCLLLLVCCASYVVCCCLFKVVRYCCAPRSNFPGNDEVTALSRRWQRSDMNVHHLDKRSQWLALRIFLPNFHGRSNVTRVGDLHEAWLLSMTEDGSFDDVLPAYKTFANNVMLLQGTRLVHHNWDRFKLQVNDLETLDAFIAPLLGVLFLLIELFLICVLSNFVF